MRIFTRLSDRELDRLFAGEAPGENGDLEELADFFADTKALFEHAPSTDTEAKHLAAMSAVAPQPDPVVSTPRQRSRFVARNPFTSRSGRIAAIAALGLMLLAAFGGAASAGALPSPIQGAVAGVADNLGVSLPDENKDDGDVNNIDDGPVGNVDDGAKNDLDEGAKENKDDGAVANEDQGPVADKDDGPVEDKDDGPVDDKDDGAVDDKDDGAVEDKDDGAVEDRNEGAQNDRDDQAQDNRDDGEVESENQADESPEGAPDQGSEDDQANDEDQGDSGNQND